jgi:hypothetical protein
MSALEGKTDNRRSSIVGVQREESKQTKGGWRAEGGINPATYVHHYQDGSDSVATFSNGTITVIRLRSVERPHIDDEGEYVTRVAEKRFATYLHGKEINIVPEAHLPKAEFDEVLADLRFFIPEALSSRDIIKIQ